MSLVVDPSVSSPVLDLRDMKRVARGRRRDVFILSATDPRNPICGEAAVLKVPRDDIRKGALAGIKRRVFDALGLSGLREVMAEARYCRKLTDRWTLEGTPPMPEFLGTLRTSRGLGALWKAATDHDGSLAPTVRRMLEDGRQKEVLAPLNAFLDILFRSDIVATDITLANLVYDTTGDQPRVLMVDGFGDHRLISLRALDKTRNHADLHHRLKKIAGKAGLTYDRATRRFALPDPAGVTPGRPVSRPATGP